MFRKALAAVAVVATTATAHAAVIDFEGTTLTGAARNLGQAPADQHGPSLVNYAGFDWGGGWAVSKPLVSVNRPRQITAVTIDEEGERSYETTPVDAGFHRSMVSGETVAYTRALGSSLFASIKSLDENFSFLGAYLTSAWRQDIDFVATGLRDGVVVYTQSLVLNNAGPQLVELNFLNIDEIQFRSSGGTFLYPNGTEVGDFLNPSNAFSFPVVAFDDMSITPVPEPGTYALMLAGLAILGAGARRRVGGQR